MTNFYLLISQRGAILADAQTYSAAWDKAMHLYSQHGTNASIYHCTLVAGAAVQDIAAAFTEVVAPIAGAA